MLFRKNKTTIILQSFLSVAVSLSFTACDDNKNDLQTLTSAIQCQDVQTAIVTDQVGDLQLHLVNSYVSGNDFDSSSAEIVSYDSCADKLYVVNAQDKTIDVLGLSESDSSPSKIARIDLNTAAEKAGIRIGAANSVSARAGLIAVAIEAETKQNAGIVALYKSDDLSLLNTYVTGALPDMVLLSDDARLILVANEGEPSADYKVDPEGSVTLIDLTHGLSNELALVKQIRFDDFNVGQPRHNEILNKVRITGPAGTSVAQDLEPEYLSYDADTGKAFVVLQENNAMAIIDVASASVDMIKSLGLKSWEDNELDASNKDGSAGQFASYAQLKGLYMPDTAVSYSVAGKTYIITANEGDGREYIYETDEQPCLDAGHIWDGGDCISYIDEARGGDLNGVDSAHVLYADLQDKTTLARIKVVTADIDAPIAKDEDILTFGARSFSIWDDNAELVFDSGDELAKHIFATSPAAFNATNDNNLVDETSDNRSDDKGIEPEAVEVAEINGRFYAFIGMERQGGVAIYDVTNPQAPSFKSYLNHRDFSQDVCTAVDNDGDCENGIYNPTAGDLGPESIEYFSRIGKHFIAVGNEVSGTTTVFELQF